MKPLTRRCRGCSADKPLDQYNKKKTGRGGLTARCKDCLHKAARKFYENNAEKVKKNSLDYYNKNIDVITRKNQAYRNQNPEKVKEANHKKHLWTNFRLTSEQYSSLLVKQNNSCVTCNVSFEDKTPHVDHNHKTGKVRGILCQNCNLVIGHAYENIDILRQIIAYLSRSRD